mmetsp:Transcript_58932/g.108875  ORF Transcript_58932/g.108875 Transcript_58932/m.108875 type:complete len:595 (-) Transcript_58932:113-1897(-)
MLQCMLRTTLIIAIAAGFLGPCALAQTMPAVALWPHPRQFSNGAVNVAVDAAIGLEFVNTSAALQPKLKAAFDRFKSNAFVAGDDPDVFTSGLSNVVVSVQSSPDLQQGVDESYSLEVPVQGDIKLTAATVYGAYHGLTSLMQLIEYDYDTLAYYISYAPWTIKDAPRYPHRELLVDTSRHFEPVVALEHIIDSMAMAKLNVFHWHIIDIQSFPAASRVHPELAQKGAYGPTERYSWAQMKGLVEYARARGIRVVPEFDVPAHTDSWYKSHPEFFPAGCTKALDPAKPEVYTFLQEILKDWSEIFTDNVMHLGTDELPTACWNNSVDIAFMEEHGLHSLNDLFGYFVKEVVQIAEGLGKHACVWDESIIRTNMTPATAMIQIWHSDAGLRETALSAGHNVIYNPANVWYLDHLPTTWETMYEVEPEPSQPIGPGKVLGGGGEMWGETVDPSDLESTVWPRMAAIAERLWSPKESTTGAQAAQARMLLFRCWLLQHGVRSGVVGGLARAAPPGPGACSQQGKPPTTPQAPSEVKLAELTEKESIAPYQVSMFHWVAAACTAAAMSLGVVACCITGLQRIRNRRYDAGSLLAQHVP